MTRRTRFTPTEPGSKPFCVQVVAPIAVMGDRLLSNGRITVTEDQRTSRTCADMFERRHVIDHASDEGFDRRRIRTIEARQSLAVGRTVKDLMTHVGASPSSEVAR